MSLEQVADFKVLSNGWELWDLALGRLTEVSGEGGGGGLTLAASFLAYAQERGYSSLWLSSIERPFYPPDMQKADVDLERLAVIFLDQPLDAALAGIRLLSSGGYDLIIWDVASWSEFLLEPSSPVWGRIGALARRHRVVVLALTRQEREAPSLTPLVGLRLQVEASRGDLSCLEVTVLKDKRGTAGASKLWYCNLPEGWDGTSLPGSRKMRAGVALHETIEAKFPNLAEVAGMRLPKGSLF